MTKAQTAQLLTLIAAFDRRTIGETDVEAWHLVIGGLDVEDCMTAVKEHYTENRDWLMPADVNRRATDLRRRREGQARIAAMEAQIAAENPGAIVQRDVKALTVGQPIRDDEATRAERRRMLQAAAHTKQRQVEQDTEARAAERERLAAARAELDAVREKAGADD